MKKAITFTLVLLTVFFCGCTKEDKDSTTTQETTKEIFQKADYLTGLETENYEAEVPRPVAVTVNNIDAALPQYGISEADIIMEMPVEGGITRLMALYSDYRNVPSVCSIRSCRYYFPVFAKGFDAVYFCYGSNELLGTPMLKKSGIDYIDGNKAGDSLVFERDGERLEIYSPEHTVCLKGENMPEIFEKYGFNEAISPATRETVFDFSDEKQSFGYACEQITGSFSSSYSSSFLYDTENEVYLKNHNKEKHIDGKTGKQLSFTNVFLLKADTSTYEDTSLVEIDWHGGKGIYLTMGTAEKITWKKKSESAPIEFFRTDGKALQINKGKSYIGVGVADVIMSR